MLERVKKLLLVKPSSLGDIVHSLAFLNAVKENFPDIKIHWIVSKEFEELLTEHPLIDKVITVDKNRWKDIKNIALTVKEFQSLREKLKNEKYDITVDLQGLFRSGFITWLSASPVRAGFKEAREFSSCFYNKKISVSVDTHAVLRYLEVAKAFGCKINSVKFPLPQEKEPDWLSEFNDFVVIIPSTRWQSKNWPLPYFIEIIKMLPYNFLIIGSKSDEAEAFKIEQYTKGKARSVAGKTTLKELIAAFKKSLFVITPDTGTMHLAVACGKKVVALFGPTSPQRTGPFGQGHLIVKSELPCSPCFRRHCRDQKCMREITPQVVYNRVVEWMAT
ncbi:MAG: lipopolysaccharide heptosyltransferase I [Thermodesulfovibrio sp.]|jgi:heptosyltransferase-1|uniref:Lipopolysaccharide heptosyltransferase 1 n=2 Tax=Thermodesulfovibrio TaxID=28261 RepID=A0A2J6WQG8_9BACT|nr:MAG: glycosyltransferase family 9 protein [Thermodesulfovibrio aggregans]